jgi:hypothetical protein
VQHRQRALHETMASSSGEVRARCLPFPTQNPKVVSSISLPSRCLKNAESFWESFCLFRQNRTVRFHKPVCPIFTGSYTRTKLTPFFPLHSFHSLLLNNNHEGSPSLPNGDFLIPPWSPLILGWIQLPKNRCLRFSHWFSPSKGIFFQSSISLPHEWI